MSDESYSRSVAKVVVAQLLAAQGLDGVQTSSVDVLADLLLRYIAEVGKQSHMYAELGHRTEVNPVDVAQALSATGLRIEDLAAYRKQLEDEPFAQTIAKFPIEKRAPLPATFASCNEAPPPHIPSFFPTLPDAHARERTAKYPEPQQSAEQRQEQLAKQQQGGEDALLRVEARQTQDNAVLQRAAQAAAARSAPGDEQHRASPGLAAENPFLSQPAPWESKPPAAAPVSLPNIGLGDEVVASQSAAAQQWITSTADAAPEAPGLQFGGFQWGTGISANIALTTGGNPDARMEDAYGAALEEGEDTALPGGRRRLLVGEEMKRARVRELVATRAEEEHMQGLGDAMLDQEQI